MASQSVARYGGLHILVNCAAGNFLAAAEQLSSNGFKTVMEIDTLGTFNMSRSVGGRGEGGAGPSPAAAALAPHHKRCWCSLHAAMHRSASNTFIPLGTGIFYVFSD